MLVTVDTLDIIRQLEADPALRAQLRAVLLGDEFLGLPGQVGRLEAAVQRLAEAQARTDARLERLEAAVERLAEAQARTDANVAALAEAQVRTDANVAALAEAQVRTDANVAALAERVGRLEAAVERLAEAQARTDARLERLEAAVERLAEAQARTDANVGALAERVGRLELGQERLEEGLRRLEQRHDELRTEVGRLSAVVGGTVEEDAASLIETVLARKGWVLIEAPHAVDVDGELDVLARAQDGEGRPVTVLAEAKVRLRPADVRRFGGSLQGLLRAAGISGDHLGYVYGLRVYSGSEDAARELGLGVLSYDGERVEPVRQTA